MIRKITLLNFFVLAFSVFVNAQIAESDFSKYSFREKFETANTLTFVEQQYDLALPIWKNLIQEQPDNFNLNYKYGYCILNASTGKAKALPYLEKARNGITKNYAPYDFDEKNAPNEVLYYLAKAYHLNYKLNEAQQTLDVFRGAVSKKHVLTENANLLTIQSEVAKKQVGAPKNYIIKNVGNKINGPYSDFGPVITGDNNVLFFTSRRLRTDNSNKEFISPQDGKFFEDVYVSYRDKETGEWGEPKVIDVISNPRSNQASISASIDGKTLFVYVDDEGDGNIYTSEYDGNEYTRLKKMEGKINSLDWETHATISTDGNTLFFVSDREGGFGGRDIYKVVKLPNGEWSEPSNLGPTINTKYDEDSPFFHPDDQTLFFSSNGETSMGGFDIFYSHLQKDGSWSSPTNIGYPLNTVDDDIFLVTTPDGKYGYFSSLRDDGFGEKDIYTVDMDPSITRPISIVKGYLANTDCSNVKVVVTPLTKQDGAKEYTPRGEDGGYVIVLKPCNDYRMDYYANDSLKLSENISIPCDSKYFELVKTFDLCKLDLIAKEDEKVKEAEYEKYFEYNATQIQSEEDKFKQFVNDSKEMVSSKNILFITIEGSASRVPTQTWGDNFKLANQRTEEAKKLVLEELKKQGINMENVIIETRSSVQGPKYVKDFKDTEKYGPFQYVKIKAELKAE